MSRRAAASLGALLLLSVASLAAWPAGADHVQSSSGKQVVFDHRVGNEWWVEVFLGGRDGPQVTAVAATDDGASWVPLQKRSWGNWAASFHIEPGNRVQFRATWADGAQATSCWFTHPVGVEQCAGAAPFRSIPMGDSDMIFLSQVSLGDADRDGRSEVYVSGADISMTDSTTGLERYVWDGSRWTRTDVPVPARVGSITVGDGDNDGRSEVYGAGNGTLWRVHGSGGAFVGEVIATIPERGSAGITLGDLDRDGRREVVLVAVGSIPNETPEAPPSAYTKVYSFAHVGGSWQRQLVAEYGATAFGTWVGDGDRDGAVELYVAAAQGTFQVERTASGWTSTPVAAASYSVVAGDGDRDGKGEVYRLPRDRFHPDPSVYMVVKGASGWTETRIATLDDQDQRLSDLFLGDGDNDGTQELYFTTERGAVHQLRWDGAGWVDRVIGSSAGSAGGLAVGDGDGDRKAEAYVGFETGDCSDTSPCHGFMTVFTTHDLAPPAGFDATFTGVKGNAWWIQAGVQATGGTLAKVEASLDGGAWRPLENKGWGWAASYHAPEGTVVQLRATSTAGATDASGCYRWVAATPVACGSRPAFDATFTGVKGNSWWVQAQVAANEPLAGVDARVDCGTTWRPLTLQSWGGWAASFHIPDGSKVDFRARSAGGATDLSGGYVWPHATPTGGC